MLKFIKNIAVGLGIALVFLVVIELILMIAGVKPLYDRTDTSVGFSGYAPLFQERVQADGKRIYETAPNKTQWFKQTGLNTNPLGGNRLSAMSVKP